VQSEPLVEIRPPEAPPDSAADRRSPIAEWTVTVLLLLFGATTLVQAFVIPTGSMEDTLLVGDHLLVDKLAYAPPGALSGRMLPYRDVRRGDIVVFRFPSDITKTYVKRVVGVPGDRIRIEERQLFVNGRPVVEPYKVHKADYPDSYRERFPAANGFGGPVAPEALAAHVADGEIVVPPGRYFALGDNRDASSDSRVWGFVPRENIIGKPLIIYWSYDALPGEIDQPNLTWNHAKDLAQNFFRKTRWRRTFRIVRAHPLE
jgi:signal peptidase I